MTHPMISTSLGEFESVQSAWKAVNLRLFHQGRSIDSVTDDSSIGSMFGKELRPFRELAGVSFRIYNVRKRLVESDVRKLNVAFLFANYLWTISGSARIDMITHYNRRGVFFSDDGATLASAFGPRLFAAPACRFDKLADLLRRDPTTRRAVVGLFNDEALASHSKDVSCALALQFLIRDGRLNCITFMRSQSAAMVLPYDLFLFTMLHEAMATRLGCELGWYQHECASLHFYEDELGTVQGICAEGGPYRALEMPPMLSFNDRDRYELMQTEQQLRELVPLSDLSSLAKIKTILATSSLDNYWRSVFSAFMANRLDIFDTSGPHGARRHHGGWR